MHLIRFVVLLLYTVQYAPVSIEVLTLDILAGIIAVIQSPSKENTSVATLAARVGEYLRYSI